MIKYILVTFLIYSSTLCSAGTIGDINNDGIINSTEAVYALQVSADISNQLTVSIADGHSLDSADGDIIDTVYVDNVGKVGIGTKTPSAIFSIVANGDSFANELNGLVTIPIGYTVVLGVGTTFTKETIAGESLKINNEIVTIESIQSDSQLTLTKPHKSGANSERIFATNDIVNIKNSNGVETLVVDKSSNIGIGTNNPKSKLEVSGIIHATSGGIKLPDGSMLKSTLPFFDSGWFEMKSQAGPDSFTEISHNLGTYPSKVKVLIKAIDGNNEGYIFEGMGMAQADDDAEYQTYGGVVFAYNQTKVRLWAPDRDTHSATGAIINIRDGWGGEVNSQKSHTALVRVLVW